MSSGRRSAYVAAAYASITVGSALSPTEGVVFGGVFRGILRFFTALSRAAMSPTSLQSPPPKSVSVGASKLSPEGKEDVAPLRLPPGCQLECEFEAKVRTPPRLVLKEKKKLQLQWPLAELSRIEVAAGAGDAEPCVR